MSWRKESNLAWLRELPGVRLGEPLASRTSFGIGGPAEYFAEMANPQSIEVAIEGCRLRGIPHLLLGAGAGLKMMRLARIAADAGLRSFEFAIGVPGTVGGAVYQNAGCWGHELREVLVDVRGFQPGADRRTWTVDDLQLGYRTSALRDGPLRGSLVIDMTIKLERGDGEEARRLMAKLTSERNETQPIKTKNCGSVFMNPRGDSAGRLIQAAGLKGAPEGNAVSSQLHGNFIVNEGGATALDVAGLIERARATVMHRFGIELEREVELVGKWE